MVSDDMYKVKRHPDRASYEREELNAILDSGYVCQVAFHINGQPFVIPMMYYNDSEIIYLHGSPAARIINHFRSGESVAISFLEINGLVIAKRLANNSMNYRAAIVYGKAEEIDDDKEKSEIFRRWIDKMMPGRSDETVPPSPKELQGVSVFKIKVDEFSIKIRIGGPADEGNEGSVWSGVIPMSLTFSDPEFESSQTPAYIKEFVTKNNVVKKN